MDIFDVSRTTPAALVMTVLRLASPVFDLIYGASPSLTAPWSVIAVAAVVGGLFLLAGCADIAYFERRR